MFLRLFVSLILTVAIFFSGVVVSRAGRRAATSVIPPNAWTHPIGEPFNAGKQADIGYKIIDDGPVQGAPLGGIGAGTIGRTYAGDFARWHTNIGVHTYHSVPADMCSLYTKQGENSTAQALYTGNPGNAALKAWNWNYPVGKGTYWALYPRSGFVYEGLPVALSVEQFSPVIPHDYQA